MIYGNNQENDIEIPIDVYAKRLVFFMKNYLDRINEDSLAFSEKATEKAKITLRWVIFQNREFEKDYKKIEDKSGRKTEILIRRYTTCIMTLLGEIAEAVIVDKCAKNADVNKVLMNIASFKNNIYEEYQDISYDNFMAFSTSFKYILCQDKSGVWQKRKVPDYNPNHTSKDIAWFDKGNMINQLKVFIPAMKYFDNAKLQIKTTLNCDNLDLRNYYLTPVICFDLLGDIERVKVKYPKNIIYSMREISQETEIEVEQYFKILGAYATGITDRINITNIDVQEDNRLAEILRTPIEYIINKKNPLDIAGIMELAEKEKKPIILNV